jgi:hypothetical protein
MRFNRSLMTAVVTIAVSSLLVAGAFAASPHPSMPGSMNMNAKSTLTASDLRVRLDNLFGEHAALAMNATNAGVTGSKSFPAAKAAGTFLNGKYMWRAHIKFFVDYTVAKAKKDVAAQKKAVADLKQYTVTFGDFLAGATGLSKLAVRNDLLGHVLELKGQLDAYASGNYSKAASQYHAAYNHMFMTGDLVAAAIAKQKGLR